MTDSSPQEKLEPSGFKVDLVNPEVMFDRVQTILNDHTIKKFGFPISNARLGNGLFHAEATDVYTHPKGLPLSPGYDFVTRLYLGPDKLNKNNGYYSQDQVWVILERLQQQYPTSRLIAYSRQVNEIQVPDGDITYRLGLGYTDAEAKRAAIKKQAKVEMSRPTGQLGWGVKGLAEIEQGLRNDHIWFTAGSSPDPGLIAISVSDASSFKSSLERYARFYQTVVPILTEVDGGTPVNATVVFTPPNR